jgi:hypothetical protein
MPDIDTVRGWQGRTMVDRDGDRIGSIEDIYTDDQSGEPEWALVKTGMFGTKSSFVPIVQASQRNGDVQVPFDKRLVKDAPSVEADEHLSEAEEQQLWRHYGLDYGADEAMTRSEEELRAGTETRERGRVRLRRYVITEEIREEQIEVDEGDTDGRDDRRP